MCSSDLPWPGGEFWESLECGIRAAGTQECTVGHRNLANDRNASACAFRSRHETIFGKVQL